MYFSTKNLSLDEKFKSAPRTYIKTFLIPNFFCKKTTFLCFESAPGAKSHGGAFLYAKTSEDDLHLFGNIFCAP